MADDLLTGQRNVFRSGLTTAEKFVYLAVLDHWSRSEPEPFPGADRLASWTSMHPRAVLRTLRGLEQKLALSIKRSTGLSNRYDLSAAFDGRLPVTQDDPSPTVTGHTRFPPPVTDGSHHPSPTDPLRNPEKEPMKEPTPASPSSAVAFALESPAPAEPKRHRKPRAPAPAGPTESSGATTLKVHYVTEYERTRGKAPVFEKWSRAVKAFRALADLVGVDDGRNVITHALSDEFTRRIEPWELVQDVNKHRAQPARRTNARATPTQPNHGINIEMERYE